MSAPQVGMIIYQNMCFLEREFESERVCICIRKAWHYTLHTHTQPYVIKLRTSSVLRGLNNNTIDVTIWHESQTDLKSHLVSKGIEIKPYESDQSVIPGAFYHISMLHETQEMFPYAMVNNSFIRWCVLINTTTETKIMTDLAPFSPVWPCLIRGDTVEQ